jgi:hypothetical protein
MKDEGGRMKKGYHSLEELSQALYSAKAARRKQLARLPIHKKIEIVVQLQKLAAPLLKAQGKRAVVWKIEPADKKAISGK